MSRLVTVATCNLNQWSLDFSGNLDRIKNSIKEAKRLGARLRTGPELEISGYGCQDHFLEGDTYMHSWHSLASILEDKELYDIIIDVGMPIRHKNINYNCRLLLLNGTILLIRPKQYLANDGNYREQRYFTPWTKSKCLENHFLPRIIEKINKQSQCKFGDGVISTKDTCIGIEMCEELFTPDSPHIHMGLDGVEIFLNGSGSHHELRKLNKRVDLIKHATTQSGGLYLYANQQGCDGDRVYYDGSALIGLNGNLLAQASQFSLAEMEVITAIIDLESIRSFRSNNSSRSNQATNAPSYPRIETSFYLSTNLESDLGRIKCSEIIQPYFVDAGQEISLGPACWLWDYLRRSNQSGFFLPLSGGLDSCSTAVIVYSMCDLVVKACQAGDKQVIKDARRICGINNDNPYLPNDPKEFCGRIFHTAYMGTKYSGNETRNRAATLAKEIGSYHLNFDIDTIIATILTLFITVTSCQPKFDSQGGTRNEHLALQNIQARLRMILAYLFAQLLPWTRGCSGNLLVLGSANVDECLRGYFTKYDCSSADLNPIGGISKLDLRNFLSFAHHHFNINCLPSFLNAQPSAELIPLKEGQIQQDDEIEMGLTYSELSNLGKLRQLSRLGPFGMFQHLIHQWNHLSIQQIKKKVRDFYFYYGINRHKMTVLTPSYHAESYSPDDHRFDHRPFLYNVQFNAQFSAIDQLAAVKLEEYNNNDNNDSNDDDDVELRDNDK